MTLVQPCAVFADVMTPSNAFAVNPDFLIGSASNVDPYGIATMELTDEDYGVSLYSSLGTVNNTISFHDTYFWVLLYNEFYGTQEPVRYPLGNNRIVYQVPAGYSLLAYGLWLDKGSLPNPGNYQCIFDYSSDFAVDYFDFQLYSSRLNTNATPGAIVYSVPFSEASGDFYSNILLELGSVNNLVFEMFLENSLPSGSTVAGTFAVQFTKTSASPSYSTAGVGDGAYDYEADVSGSLSNISSSIGDMSESLDSAAENLEYISTSQNLIIQGIDNVIMHISDQLYAFWDQLYNLIHEPTYARLEQILLALKAIANNSDISAVVDTIEETTQQQITNDNSNTSKVESAVEKHGNFIIEGLKGLFIPSDEYFKSYFDDLYTYFSDRFGFLSFPIDLLVRLVDLFVNSSDKDCILTLPEFEISGEKLITEASFNLTEFLENDFGILLSSIRLVTSIGLIMAFVNLCQDKWNEVMRN